MWKSDFYDFDLWKMTILGLKKVINEYKRNLKISEHLLTPHPVPSALHVQLKLIEI